MSTEICRHDGHDVYPCANCRALKAQLKAIEKRDERAQQAIQQLIFESNPLRRPIDAEVLGK